jgi:hypothetical protein
MELITATECVNKLRQAGVFKGKLPYFIQLANGGYIPHHEKPGSSKRWYRYEEAKAAIKDMEDPTRDAQREANKRKRKPEPIQADQTPKQITEILTRIKNIEELHPEAFDRSQLDPESAETFDSDIVEMNGQNRIIGDLTFDLLDFLDGLSGGSFRSSQAELKVAEYLDGWIIKPDTVRELYAID